MTTIAFTVATQRAKIARGYRQLAKQYQAWAREGIDPHTNLSHARRCQSKAREQEAWIRNLANRIMAG